MIGVDRQIKRPFLSDSSSLAAIPAVSFRPRRTAIRMDLVSSQDMRRHLASPPCVASCQGCCTSCFRARINAAMLCTGPLLAQMTRMSGTTQRHCARGAWRISHQRRSSPSVMIILPSDSTPKQDGREHLQQPNGPGISRLRERFALRGQGLILDCASVRATCQRYSQSNQMRVGWMFCDSHR